MKKYNKILFMVIISFLTLYDSGFSQVLPVPEVIQERRKWCWAACSKCILTYYYNLDYEQCEIAEYTRIVAQYHNYGSVNCCLDSTLCPDCNYGNPIAGGYGTIADILFHFGNLLTTPWGNCLTIPQIQSEINDGRPFIIQWNWYSGGAHVIVGHGYDGTYLYYMNPSKNIGWSINSYAWVVDNGDHIWSLSLTMNPPLENKWQGGVSGDWQSLNNWSLGHLPTTGENNIFDNGLTIDCYNVPSATLNNLYIKYNTNNIPTSVTLRTGLATSQQNDGQEITFLPSLQGGAHYADIDIENGCSLNCNVIGQRVKIICEPGVHVSLASFANFHPAQYSPPVFEKGFILKTNNIRHAELIQQDNTSQNIKGWVEYIFDDNKYHFLTPPITSVWPLTGEFLNIFYRKPNCLCVFNGDYLRKFTNGVGWGNWLGNVGSCTSATIVNIETGKGYEYYGNPLNNPTGLYSFYGPLNTGSVTVLATISAGWHFIGNPFPSAVSFGPYNQNNPTPGPGWTWDCGYIDPVAYWWDNRNGGFYRFYNWYIGSGNSLNQAESRTIPRSQGFFVNVVFTSPPESNIIIGNQARIFRGTEQIGKSILTNNMNVTLNDASGKIIDEALINFRDDASGNDFDRLRDAYKFYNDITNVSQLYFKTTDNVDVALKTLQLINGQVMYPLYMKVVYTGTYSLDVKDISTFSPNTSILLKDNKTNTTVDLKVNPVYNFSANAGEDDARFSLYFTNVLGFHTLCDNNFKVYSYDNSIFIQDNDPKGSKGKIFVYDMIGRQMMQQELYNEAITRINTNLNKGIYIVSIKTDKGVYNQKVYIN
jgi:hypothetical protein